MFRLWGKIIKSNKIAASYTAECNHNDLSNNELVNICLDDICRELDIQKPIWLPVHEKDFKRYGISKFYADAFMEEINFHCFEIEYIEEDDKKKH